MTARRNYTFTNKYIPPATKTDLKWYERDLDTWFDEMKYNEATDNPDQYFSNVKVVNFDIIYNDYKRKLEKPIQEYQAIFNKDLDNYEPEVKNNMLSSAHRSEYTDIFFTKDLDRRHFLQKYPNIELSSMKKRFKKATESCKSLPFSFLLFPPKKI